MSAERIQHGGTRRREQMCSDLLTCKDGTQQLYTSEEFPMNENRLKKDRSHAATVKVLNRKRIQKSCNSSTKFKGKISTTRKNLQGEGTAFNK